MIALHGDEAQSVRTLAAGGCALTRLAIMRALRSHLIERDS